MNISLKLVAIAVADYKGHRVARELSEDTPVV
jgi:hypothetical protein